MKVHCPACGPVNTDIESADSVPYCPSCGRPVTPDMVENAEKVFHFEDEQDKIDQLNGIREDIENLVHDALEIIQDLEVGDESSVTHHSEQAQAYWYSHILGALSKDSGVLGGSLVTMAETINSLKQLIEEKKREDEEK